MFDFSGSAKRPRNVKLSGSSDRASKDELLKKTQEERRIRDAERKKVKCASKISRFIRGRLLWSREKVQLRIELRAYIQQLLYWPVENSNFAINQIKSKSHAIVLICRILVFIFDPNEDVESLSAIVKYLVDDHNLDDGIL
jgi:ubiquitin-protein ligase E3 C